jgi:hypothetical protein
MKRLPNAFYDEFHAHRDQFGAAEYDVDDMLGAAVAMFKKHAGDDAGDQLILDALRGINDGIEEREASDGRQLDFFSHDGHVALGEKRRIRRGRMTFDHLLRRKLVIDRNQMAQNQAWAVETSWLNDRMEAVRGRAGVAIEDVLNEDGSIKSAEPVPA